MEFKTITPPGTYIVKKGTRAKEYETKAPKTSKEGVPVWAVLLFAIPDEGFPFEFWVEITSDVDYSKLKPGVRVLGVEDFSIRVNPSTRKATFSGTAFVTKKKNEEL